MRTLDNDLTPYPQPAISLQPSSLVPPFPVLRSFLTSLSPLPGHPAIPSQLRLPPGQAKPSRSRSSSRAETVASFMFLCLSGPQPSAWAFILGRTCCPAPSSVTHSFSLPPHSHSVLHKGKWEGGRHPPSAERMWNCDRICKPLPRTQNPTSPGMSFLTLKQEVLPPLPQ